MSSGSAHLNRQIEVKTGAFSILAEGEGTMALSDGFNAFPFPVADEQLVDVELSGAEGHHRGVYAVANPTDAPTVQPVATGFPENP